MLKNYSCLRGVVSEDLEDHTKYTRTHHNLIVRADEDYQVNIDTQSASIANVKVYYVEQLSNNELLTNLNKLGNNGLFCLDELTYAYKLDYLRSRIFQIDYLKNAPVKPWQEISSLLDAHITRGTKICILGNTYNNETNSAMPYGLQLRQEHNYLPPKGIHNIHLNQGDPASHNQNDGIYQDGAIFIETPNDGTKAFFFMFAEQSLLTDNSGNFIDKH